MLFKFSTPVNLTSVVLKNFNNPDNSPDRDMTYYTSNSAASSITLGSLANLGNMFSAPTTVDCVSCSNAVSNASTDAFNGQTGVTYLLIGASISSEGTADYFKISDLNVSTGFNGQQSTPEPSTIQTGLFALAGFGFWMRRRSLARRS